MRFPEFSGEWKLLSFVNLYKIVKINEVINKNQYLKVGNTPIIDQGNELICGYSNQIGCKLPTIVYGDHTTYCKYIDFEFLVGSDGTKSLRSKNDNLFNLHFLYYCLLKNNLASEGYKRHFPILKTKNFYITTNKLEQSKIANFLSLIDKRIELQNKIIRDYKLLKKGIQNCFLKNINSDNSYSLSCFLEEYTLKNLKNNLQVVSVGKYGIRQRNEIYSKVLSDDLSKNKVIFQDTLTIGMGTKQIDFGILSKNVEYCVSPAYRTYKIKNINSEYLKYYLEIINNQLSRKYMIISARQGTTIDNKSFLKHQLVVHPILKQNYIVNVINIIQKYLTISDDILETHKDLKKYLLKHIFI